MEAPHTVNSPLRQVKRGDASTRDMLQLAPWALLVTVLGAVVCSPVLYVLVLYLLFLDAWLQGRPLFFVLVVVASALVGLSVIGVRHQRGDRARPGMVALARAAGWWQLPLLPVLVIGLARFLGDASLLFGWLPLALLLQPLGTLLLRRTQFLLTGAALKAVVLVPPSMVLLLATPTAHNSYGSSDDRPGAAFLHLVGVNGIVLAAAIAVAAYLAHRADPSGIEAGGR